MNKHLEDTCLGDIGVCLRDKLTTPLYIYGEHNWEDLCTVFNQGINKHPLSVIQI